MKVIILGVSSVKIVILEMMESGVSQYWNSLDCDKIMDTINYAKYCHEPAVANTDRGCRCRGHLVGRCHVMEHLLLAD